MSDVLRTDSEPQLRRSLSLLSVTMLGVGAMIGAGIFVLVGIAAGLAGPSLLLVFVLNAGFAVTVGACYAELCAAIPRTGGAYVWVGTALGRRAGFLAGWMSWFAQTIACALYAAGFGSFAFQLISEQLPGAGGALAAFASAGLILTITAINVRSAGSAGRTEIAVTGIKIALLLVVIAFGFVVIFGQPEPLAPYRPFFPLGLPGVVTAMAIIFIAFEGYEIIAQTREEIVDPERNVPLAIFASIGISVVIYLGVAAVLLGAVVSPSGQPTYVYLGELGELGLAEASEQFLPYGRTLLLIAGLASTASAFNATIYSSSRICFSMGREGDLPRWLSAVDREGHTPHRALWTTAAISMVLAIWLPLQDIAAAANIMFFFVFQAVCYVVIRLRTTAPDLARPFRTPFVPLWPATGIIGGIVLSLSLLAVSLKAWGIAIAWIALGALYSSRRR